MMTSNEWLDQQREQGWRYSATTPVSVTPEAVEEEHGIDSRSAVLTEGYRTWLFRTEGDMREFRQYYGVSTV